MNELINYPAATHRGLLDRSDNETLLTICKYSEIAPRSTWTVFKNGNEFWVRRIWIKPGHFGLGAFGSESILNQEYAVEVLHMLDSFTYAEPSPMVPLPSGVSKQHKHSCIGALITTLPY